MKTFLLTLAAASAITAAALPATAQSYGGPGFGPGYERGPDYERGIAQGDNLQWRIDRAERDGRIAPRAADRLRDQLRVADRLSWTYRRDGVITRAERADLDRRYAYVAQSLRGWRQSQGDRYDRAYDDRDHDWRR